MNEQLIELVQKHEELYNFANKNYSDNLYKNRLWKEFIQMPLCLFFSLIEKFLNIVCTERYLTDTRLIDARTM